MTGSGQGDGLDTGEQNPARRGGAHGRARASRPRARHATNRVRKPGRVDELHRRDQPLAYDLENETLTSEQTLSVEVQPIGGIFGAHAPNLPPGPGRLGRVSRAVIRRSRSTLAPSPSSLLDEPYFRTLWLSRLLSQTAQGALLYALLILVVDLSNRSFFNSLFVICSIVPAIAFGLPAGIVVDTVSRKSLMLVLNLFRFLFMVCLIVSEPSLMGVFAATLGIWIIHQFYSPAEASVLAEIVPRDRYLNAQSLFNLALTISQVMGLIIAAPILLRIGGPRLVFLVCGTLWLISAALSALLPSRSMYRVTRRTTNRSLRQALGNGWRFARVDRLTFEAIIDDVLVGVGMSALVVIMPFYLERVLGTSKENTVFVFAPAALGLVLGLRVAPKLARFIGEQHSATLSLFGFAACVAALGFVESTYNFLNDTLRLPLDSLTDALGISPLISVAMLVSIPAGCASAIVNVSARSILLARSPSHMRGQVIATQSLIGNVGSLIPTLLAGIATDIFGVKPIAVGIAVCIVVAAMMAHSFGRRTPLAAPVPQT
ncbi:MAG: MFS transporter [Chloroflexia bacterium]|nr:MFS transporter [Chloroflexia bacterium]